jgi:hypothetical protein
MKVKFTVTLSKRTMRAYKSLAYDNDAILDDLKEAVREVLKEVNDGFDEDEEDEDDD